MRVAVLFRATGCWALGMLAFVAANPATAESTSRQASGTVHLPLYGLTFDGSAGVAVGENGQVFDSFDAGRTWQAETAVTKVALLGVVARSGHSIAVGQAGFVMIRAGADVWRPVKVDTTERLMGVDMNAAGLAVIVGAFGTLLTSTDFGATWHKSAADWPSIFAANADTLGAGFAPHLYGVDVRENGEIYVVGELSLILAASGSHTGTVRDWRVIRHGGIVNGESDPSLFGIRIRDDGTGFAVGQSGRVLRTLDGGRDWTRIETGTDAILLAVASTDLRHVLLTGIREMLTSDDDGQHWRRIESPDVANDWYVAAARPEGSATVVAGSSGKILKVAD